MSVLSYSVRIYDADESSMSYIDLANLVIVHLLANDAFYVLQQIRGCSLIIVAKPAKSFEPLGRFSQTETSLKQCSVKRCIQI